MEMWRRRSADLRHRGRMKNEGFWQKLAPLGMPMAVGLGVVVPGGGGRMAALAELGRSPPSWPSPLVFLIQGLTLAGLAYSKTA